MDRTRKEQETRMSKVAVQDSSKQKKTKLPSRRETEIRARRQNTIPEDYVTLILPIQSNRNGVVFCL